MGKFTFRFLILSVLALVVAACQANQSIVTNVGEKEANEIVVFLASKGIIAQKIQAPSTGVGASAPTDMYNISVAPEHSTQAMALLNRQGLPHRKGTNLLDLFAKSGLMSSDREETIRYQAGLAQDLENTIQSIDGVISANVQIAFPSSEATPTPGSTPPKITAAVYIKHQGIMEDPNSHMEVKIKRFMAASVNGLDYDNVSVISDRARLADISLTAEGEPISAKALQQTYVSIWGLVLTKSSLTRFRLIFFTFIFLLLLFSAAVGWLIYKFYPLMRAKKPESSSEGPELKL